MAAILSQANGYIFLRDIRAYKDGYSDRTLIDIIRLGKRYKASKLLIESNFGDGMICELFKRHQRQEGFAADIEEVRATTRKEEKNNRNS